MDWYEVKYELALDTLTKKDKNKNLQQDYQCDVCPYMKIGKMFCKSHVETS